MLMNGKSCLIYCYMSSIPLQHVHFVHGKNELNLMNTQLYHLSRLMGKPTICIGENKDADQLRCNREADQRLCFRYSDSTLTLLLKSKISSFKLFSVLVQTCLCQTCSETTLLVFPRGGSVVINVLPILTLFLGAAMGSEKAKKGSAKLQKPFLYDSIFL